MARSWKLHPWNTFCYQFQCSHLWTSLFWPKRIINFRIQSIFLSFSPAQAAATTTTSTFSFSIFFTSIHHTTGTINFSNNNSINTFFSFIIIFIFFLLIFARALCPKTLFFLSKVLSKSHLRCFFFLFFSSARVDN